MTLKLVLFAALALGTLAWSAGSSAAPNYTDEQKTCLNACREREACFGGRGARDNSPRCKRCVAACSREEEEKQTESQKK
jgi:hypothetical protein